jgi:FAD/FMN-containing dehydrogenase
VPVGVLVLCNVEAGARAVEVCARFDAPVLSRGGRTSLAGQTTSTAVVIDWTKYCDALISVDPDARTCVVEPGLVLDELNRRLADHRLQFGPKPSTHSHCALGGMTGDNSCGSSAQAYGKTVDNVRRLEILTYDGPRTWVGPTSKAERARIAAEGGRKAELYDGLDPLLPENGFDVARPLEHCDPSRLEGLDGRMAQLMREEGAHLESLDVLPEGDSWLLVQCSGDSQEDVDEQAHALLRAIGRREKDADVAFSDDPEREQRMLRAREAGLGVTARPPDGRETREGWEDSAVPPERLGDYLRDLKDLFEEFGHDHPSLYGHFGQGFVHTRIPFGLRTAEGVADFRRFAERAAGLVAAAGRAVHRRCRRP